MKPARKASKPEPQTLPALPELVPSEQDGITLLDWFNGLRAFFSRAQGLEQRAKATLDAARALTAPTSAEEDHALQVFVRRASADIKETEDHWEITSLVSRFHKRLVGARKRTTDALDQAKATAQRLHNDYVEAERRRVAREQEIVRQQAEARAAQERQKELDALEAKALQAEAASDDLSEREARFVDRIVALVGWSGPVVVSPDDSASAARVVGYKDGRQGWRLMEQPKIQRAIKAKREALALREQQQAVKAQPLAVSVPEVEAQIGKGGVDRATWSGEVYDLEAWRQGIKDGTIPLDTAVPHQPTINSYARSLRENLNRWPGVRAIRKVTTV